LLFFNNNHPWDNSAASPRDNGFDLVAHTDGRQRKARGVTPRQRQELSRVAENLSSVE
jgi:hypothetical protein